MIYLRTRVSKRELFGTILGQEAERAGFGTSLESEHKFHLIRRWRLDYYVYTGIRRLGFEYEGGLWTNSRHRSGTGFRGDCEKYNQATYYGYEIYRFTCDDVANEEKIKTTRAFLRDIFSVKLVFDKRVKRVKRVYEREKI